MRMWVIKNLNGGYYSPDKWGTDLSHAARFTAKEDAEVRALHLNHGLKDLEKIFVVVHL